MLHAQSGCQNKQFTTALATCNAYNDENGQCCTSVLISLSRKEALEYPLFATQISGSLET